MSSYSSSSVTSYARTRGTCRPSDERTSPILPISVEVYVSKEAALKASSSEMESDRKCRSECPPNGKPTPKGNKSSTATNVDNLVSVHSSIRPNLQKSQSTVNGSIDSTIYSTELRSESQLLAEPSNLLPHDTGSHIGTAVVMSRDFNLDDSRDSNDQYISKRYLRRQRRREEELQCEIRRWKHEDQCNAAIAIQYRTKVKRMRTLAMAAVDRETCIIERACAQQERGIVSDKVVLSDEEDQRPHNDVKYSYIDNKLFVNEE